MKCKEYEREANRISLFIKEYILKNCKMEQIFVAHIFVKQTLSKHLCGHQSLNPPVSKPRVILARTNSLKCGPGKEKKKHERSQMSAGESLLLWPALWIMNYFIANSTLLQHILMVRSCFAFYWFLCFKHSVPCLCGRRPSVRVRVLRELLPWWEHTKGPQADPHGRKALWM